MHFLSSLKHTHTITELQTSCWSNDSNSLHCHQVQTVQSYLPGGTHTVVWRHIMHGSLDTQQPPPNSISIGSAIFAQLTRLPKPSNPMLYNAFQLAGHPSKRALTKRESGPPSWFVCPTWVNIPNQHIIGSDVWHSLSLHQTHRHRPRYVQHLQHI